MVPGCRELVRTPSCPPPGQAGAVVTTSGDQSAAGHVADPQHAPCGREGARVWHGWAHVTASLVCWAQLGHVP